MSRTLDPATPTPAGIIRAIDVAARDVTVYAPHGTVTRFRTATRARLVGENRLGGMALSVVVRVPGCEEPYVVPPAWIDPPGAPPPREPHFCVVIPFPHGRHMSPGDAS